MLFPTTFTIIASFLLKLCSSSPIFNTLPGRPSLNNAGPVGRNIRNLPCISRKSSEKGVCMFAIDCQKSNGTHLGTCIDRFYFGSCCLIDPIHDIGNSIDTAIIPSRQPPSRVSSTTTSLQSRVTEKTTIYLSPSTSLRTTLTPKPSSPTLLIGSTITKPTQYYFGDKLTTLKLATTPIVVPTASPSLSSIFLSSTNKPTLHTTNSNPSEVSYKLTTFQTVDENTVTNEPLTTLQIQSNSTRKPTTSYTKIASTTSSTKNPITLLTTLRQKPLTRKTTTKARPTTTVKPIKFSKPTKTSTTITKKPNTTTSKITKKPTLTTTTNRYVTEKPTLPSSTQKASLTTSKTAQPTTLAFRVTSPTLTTVDKISTIINLFNLTSTTLRSSSSSTSEPTTKKTLMTTLETESGNIGTNEIEQPKPLSPPPTTEEGNNSSFVTWAATSDDGKTTNKPPPTTDAWMPMTTVDSWVLLPSVTSTLNPNNSTTNLILNNTKQNETTQSEKPPEISSSSTTSTAPFDYSAENNLTFNNTSSTMSTGASSQFSSTITNLIETSSMAPLGVNMSDYTDVCGRRLYPEARIVGGERATFGKWPWQISLRQWRTSTYLHKCGAALLNENWAITAAHCVDNVPPSDLLLRLGEHDLSTDSEPYIHQERRVQIVASHPQFDPRTFEYDLALLRFYEPVQFQPNIIPVCVPKNDENFVGRTAHVTGWGRLYEDGPLPSVLQEVSVPVINNTVCESMYRSAGYIEHIPHIFICAGWRRGGFDSCEGDSGGPMVIQRPDKRFLLAGVISWGIGCAEPNQPGVYTRISEFRDWINQILQF